MFSRLGTVRPYRTVRALVHAHVGMRAVVMGGGLSLPSQLEQCPGRSSAIYISANHHGARLVGCDYIVALDKIEELVRPFGATVVSRHMYGDFRILKSPAPNSGVAAAWIAAVMGCSPIFIAGMDLGGGYFHDPDAQSLKDFTLDDTLRYWRFTMSQWPADYRVIGGPLLEHARAWNLSTTPRSRESMERELTGVTVEFTCRHKFKRRVFEAGERGEFRPHEASVLRREGVAVRIAA